jgi:hypothetical protein
LFEAVLDDALEDLFDLVDMPPPGSDPSGAIGRYVARVAQYHHDHPDLIRLVQWEALERSSNADPLSPRAQKYKAKVMALAQRNGIPSEEAAPFLVVLIVLAAGPQAMASLAGLIMGVPPTNAVQAVSKRAAGAAAAIVALAAGDSPKG